LIQFALGKIGNIPVETFVHSFLHDDYSLVETLNINYTCNRTCSLVEETYTISLLKVSRPSPESSKSGEFDRPLKIVKEKNKNVALKATIKCMRKKLSTQQAIVEQQRESMKQMNVVIQTLEADKKRLLAENNADLQEAEKEVIQNSEFLSLECQCCF
jgi:hypothetical protein